MQNQNINQIYQSITNRLSAVRRTWRWLILSESLLKWLSALAFVMLAGLLSFQLPLPPFFESWHSYSLYWYSNLHHLSYANPSSVAQIDFFYSGCVS